MGKELSGDSGFSVKRTKYSRRTADDESVQGVTMSNCEEFRIFTFLVMSDFFLQELDTRIKAYTKVDELFSFLRQTDVEAEVSLAGAIDLQGGPKKRGHSVLQKYCSDLHDFFAEIKVV